MRKKIKKTIKILSFIQKSLLKKNLIQPNQKLLVTISGGQDSISLLIILYFFQNQWNWKLKILWCNHIWQKDSFQIFLELTKLIYQFPFGLICLISLKSLKTEQKSRDWRYSSFFRINLYYLNQYIILGHTSSDRIETILFNLFRGSGTHSFYFLNWYKEIFLNYTSKFPSQSKVICLEKKIFDFISTTNKDICKERPKKFKKKYFYNTLISETVEQSFYQNKKIVTKKSPKNFYKKNIQLKKLPLIRPLLQLNRYNINNFIYSLDLPIFPDPTNQNKNYIRNRIRKQLLPLLRVVFNPQIDNTLFQYSEIGLQEENYSSYCIQKLYNELAYQNNNIYCFDLSLIQKLPDGIKTKFIRKFFRTNYKMTLSFSQTEQLLHFIFNLQFNPKEQNFIRFLFFPKIGILIFYNNQLIIFKPTVKKI